MSHKLCADLCLNRAMMSSEKDGLKLHLGQFHKIRKNASRKSERCSAVDCLASFSSPSLLKRHMDIHNNTIPYNCIYCHYRTIDSHRFGNHLSSHYDELDYKCDICGHTAQRKADLSRHMDQHNDIKYKCTICSYICQTRHAHESHIIKKHNIHEDTGDYRIEIKPNITEKDMIEMFPDRNRK